MGYSKTIGFIGTGVMGKSIISRLLDKGYNVLVYNRTREKTSEIVSQGGIWCGSVSEVARSAEIIFSMVGFPKDVEDIYFGSNGIIKNARKNTILVDMTTSSPLLAQEISSVAFNYDLFALDAPVSGGDI